MWATNSDVKAYHLSIQIHLFDKERYWTFSKYLSNDLRYNVMVVQISRKKLSRKWGVKSFSNVNKNNNNDVDMKMKGKNEDSVAL